MGSKKNKRAAAAAAAAAAGTGAGKVNGDEPPVDLKAGADGDAVPPPVVEPANGGEPGSGEEKPRDLTPEPEAEGFDARGKVAPRFGEPPVEAKGDGVPPPPPTAGAGSDEEETPRDQSPYPEAERLKALNGVLVKQAVESRGQVAALAARVEESSADAGALAGVEGELIRAVLAAPLLDAAKEGQELRARLAADQAALQAAEARAALEADARAGAAARLDAADAEKLRVLGLLGEKEAEASAASKNVSELEAKVSELAGKAAELGADKDRLEKQLGEKTVLAHSVLAQKAELEESFKDYKMNAEKYKQEMEVKIGEKLKQLEDLKSNKVQLEARFQSLEMELSDAVARNGQLELEVEKSKTELAAARTEVEKLRSVVADLNKKQTMVCAQAEYLRGEIDKMMAIKQEAESAFSAEKTKLEREIDGLKRKLDKIEANKNAVMATVSQKDAEAAKLRAELEQLRGSIAEKHALYDKLMAESSCLEDDKHAVLKELNEVKAEGGKLRMRIGELESYSGEKDHEIGALKAEVEDKGEQIDSLNGDVERLQLAVAEAQQMGKSGVWTWLCPATTTVIAAASFAYAARSR